jgi:hypothetical protein
MRLARRHASTINRESAGGVTVSDTGRCPLCGSAATAADAATEPYAVADGLEPLYREMRRIRELAEARAASDAERRIAELTRQVAELRATVARLRGPGLQPAPPRPRASLGAKRPGSAGP